MEGKLLLLDLLKIKFEKSQAQKKQDSGVGPLSAGTANTKCRGPGLSCGQARYQVRKKKTNWVRICFLLGPGLRGQDSLCISNLFVFLLDFLVWDAERILSPRPDYFKWNKSCLKLHSPWTRENLLWNYFFALYSITDTLTKYYSQWFLGGKVIWHWNQHSRMREQIILHLIILIAILLIKLVKFIEYHQADMLLSPLGSFYELLL